MATNESPIGDGQGNFKLHVTALTYLAPYAKHKVWLKASTRILVRLDGSGLDTMDATDSCPDDFPCIVPVLATAPLQSRHTIHLVAIHCRATVYPAVL